MEFQLKKYHNFYEILRQNIITDIRRNCDTIDNDKTSKTELRQCTGEARPVDGSPMTEATLGREKLEVVPSFCCLGDCLSPGGGCVTGASCMSSCPSSPAHFPSPPKKEFAICQESDLHHLQCNDWSTICWMFGVPTKDQVS